MQKVLSRIQIQKQSDSNSISYFCLSGVDLTNIIKQAQIYSNNQNRKNSFSRKPIEIRMANKLVFIDDDQVDKVVLNQLVFSQTLSGENQRLDQMLKVLSLNLKKFKTTLRNEANSNQYFFQIEAILLFNSIILNQDQYFISLSHLILCQHQSTFKNHCFNWQVVNLDGWNCVPIFQNDFLLQLSSNDLFLYVYFYLYI
ncbi:unnamed protein product [Paramecium octaurelia]|uniref:Uncharacterized protein n=1 Tax=Paramecium octaurelia TaxID=43137 RepID=A0A8S1T9A9_PAROT|nr:unnamed protein product [Paramecium octaurelia]